MVKTAPRPAPKAGPQNPSRAAGAPTVASAAATAPRSGPYYDPDPEAPSALDQGHIDTVRAQAIDIDEHNSADLNVVRAAQGDEREPGLDLEADIARARSMRKPLGDSTQKLALPEIAGYKTHWFNDESGRIDGALEAGWVHRKREGVPIRRAVGTGRDKNVLYAYAMCIPLVFWQEDMAAKHRAAEAITDGLKKNPFVAPPGSMNRSDGGKFYDPSDNPNGPLSIEKG